MWLVQDCTHALVRLGRELTCDGQFPVGAGVIAAYERFADSKQGNLTRKAAQPPAAVAPTQACDAATTAQHEHDLTDIVLGELFAPIDVARLHGTV